MKFHPVVQKIPRVQWKFHKLKSCDLENEVKVTKILSALKLVPMIYPCKFGEISPVGSRDNSHSWVQKSGMLTESALKPVCVYPSPPGEGGIKTVKLLVLLFISYACCILKKANNLQPLSSCQTTSKWRHSDLSWIWWRRSRTSFRSHVSVRWLPSR